MLAIIGLNGKIQMLKVIKIIATIALFAQRFYFGPVGAGGGICDAIILWAIWGYTLNENKNES